MNDSKPNSNLEMTELPYKYYFDIPLCLLAVIQEDNKEVPYYWVSFGINKVLCCLEETVKVFHTQQQAEKLLLSYVNEGLIHTSKKMAAEIAQDQVRLEKINKQLDDYSVRQQNLEIEERRKRNEVSVPNNS